MSPIAIPEELYIEILQYYFKHDLLNYIDFKNIYLVSKQFFRLAAKINTLSLQNISQISLPLLSILIPPNRLVVRKFDLLGIKTCYEGLHYCRDEIFHCYCYVPYKPSKIKPIRFVYY